MPTRLKELLKSMASPSRRTFRVVLLSLGVLALAWQHIEATRLGYQVEAARHRVQALSDRLDAVQMTLQTSLSPAQLALRARTRLGMRPASPDVIRVLGRPAAPRPASSLFLRWISSARRELLALDT
ncbi:MAG: hypothetical protein KGO96_06355 [Elusimicrobia bacterium]|nr:hypothetical protein [Elusimicrobiota bacterium]MDE2237996.1 hypothetical protein [Elusimicrobiota bacterium]MDE2425512.1 hypothetical protein [Elusimicrobiota bacterium]